MARKAARSYQSLVRQRQADDTRQRIVEAARLLLERKGYAGMTVEAIARQAGVASQTVYAVFGSKTGIVMELVDHATFGPQYENLVRQALTATEPAERLRFAARIARQIHDAQSSTFDLLSGAGVVAPDLATLQKRKEWTRYERQESVIAYLEVTKSLKPGLDRTSARDILWALTGREFYRMLVRERGWASQKYEDWLAATLMTALLAKPPSGRLLPAKQTSAR